jgi:predicted dienelactone hydrolase
MSLSGWLAEISRVGGGNGRSGGEVFDREPYGFGMGAGRVWAVAVVAALAVPLSGYFVASPSDAEVMKPPAPSVSFAVGHRVMGFPRGADRPLRTDVWYPAGTRGRVAAGRFPVVLFSHGLRGLPEHFGGLAEDWAAAGLVVVAPAYPRTNARASDFQRADMRNQPADAAHVLRRLRALPAGDPLAGHLLTDDVAAVGFSAGAFTTTGLLTSGMDPGIRAAVVIAGWAAPGAFGGAAVPVLFVHGTADPVVPFESGRAAYERAAQPKAFVAVPGGRHGEFLKPGHPRYAGIRDQIRTFLVGQLYAPGSAGPALLAGRPAEQTEPVGPLGL